MLPARWIDPACPAPTPLAVQLYGDPDLLLGAYSVPLEYEEPLIQQVCLKVVWCR